MQFYYCDHYQLLKVPPVAPNAAIEPAFRSALVNVPRKGIDRLIACVRGRTETQLLRAFQELNDPVRRSEYDKFLDALNNLQIVPMC